MPTSEAAVYVPVFVDDLTALYVSVDGEFMSLQELIRQTTPAEIALPTATIALTSEPAAEGDARKYSSIQTSPMMLCCYTIGGRRVYLPCLAAEILNRGLPLSTLKQNP